MAGPEEMERFVRIVGNGEEVVRVRRSARKSGRRMKDMMFWARTMYSLTNVEKRERPTDYAEVGSSGRRN